MRLERRLLQIETRLNTIHKRSTPRVLIADSQQDTDEYTVDTLATAAFNNVPECDTGYFGHNPFSQLVFLFINSSIQARLRIMHYFELYLELSLNTLRTSQTNITYR